MQLFSISLIYLLERARWSVIFKMFPLQKLMHLQDLMHALAARVKTAIRASRHPTSTAVCVRLDTPAPIAK